MEGDRISALPDHLLHHILSSMDTQVVIKTTSLLSKRWTKLWTTTPSLLFDYPSFSCPHSNRKKTCFRRFIKRVLSYRRMHITPLSKVKKLSLYFLSEPVGHRHYSEELPDAERFGNEDNIVFKLLFYFAALNQAEELCINGGDVNFSNWCRHFSTCQSLKVSGYIDSMWVPHSFEFLKSLEIENYYSHFYMGLERGYFPTYPLLERLILRGSCFDMANISAPKLEYLEMACITCDEDRFGSEIWLSTPKLACIKLDNVVPILISTDDFLSINQVDFSLDYKVSYCDNEMKRQVLRGLRSVLNMLRKANSLTLNSVAVKVLSDVPPVPKKNEAFMFLKLRYFRLKGNVKKPNHIFNCLRKSPFLKEWHVEQY